MKAQSVISAWGHGIQGKSMWNCTEHVIWCLREEPKVGKGVDLDDVEKTKNGKVEYGGKKGWLHVDSLLVRMLVCLCSMPVISTVCLIKLHF